MIRGDRVRIRKTNAWERERLGTYVGGRSQCYVRVDGTTTARPVAWSRVEALADGPPAILPAVALSAEQLRRVSHALSCLGRVFPGYTIVLEKPDGSNTRTAAIAEVSIG